MFSNENAVCTYRDGDGTIGKSAVRNHDTRVTPMVCHSRKNLLNRLVIHGISIALCLDCDPEIAELNDDINAVIARASDASGAQP
jgi:hypothetical protein